MKKNRDFAFSYDSNDAILYFLRAAKPFIRDSWDILDNILTRISGETNDSFVARSIRDV